MRKKVKRSKSGKKFKKALLTKKLLKEMCAKNDLWLRRKKGGKRADFTKVVVPYGFDFANSDLTRASFRGITAGDLDFKCANLQGAIFTDGSFRDADFKDARLHKASFVNANLRCARFVGAMLERANFRNADLDEADFRDADLGKANFALANLPAAPSLLLADWGALSDETTLALMRLDCSAIQDGKSLFGEWSNGGGCPFLRGRVTGRTGRVVRFRERNDLWRYGNPPSLWECLKMVLDEKCPGWNGK